MALLIEQKNANCRGSNYDKVKSITGKNNG